MNPFALSAQSLLLVFLFLTLIFSLFLLLVGLNRRQGRRRWALSLAVFLFLFLLLIRLTGLYTELKTGILPEAWADVPVWTLWCAGIAANVLLLGEGFRLRRRGGQELSGNSVKEAMDRLPSGICYFTAAGAVKLCNLQMYRLFRRLSQKDLQTLCELKQALADCGPDTGIICFSKERQTYLFPDGRMWRFRETPLTDGLGNSYTEVVFSDVTEQYEKNLELKRQTEKLKEISRKLRRLSDNALILAREKEILSAKTSLHDQMGAALTALRRILQLHQAEETEAAVRLLRQAVSAIKNDNEYPPEKSELEKFMQDAGTVGVMVKLCGKLPQCEELSSVFLIAMRESLTNGVRHARATELEIELTESEGEVSFHITNNGAAPEGEIVPKGGLCNLYRYVLDGGGTMEIRSAPAFSLRVSLPKGREESEWSGY